MIQRLKRNLSFLFIISLILTFSIVFLLMIYTNIKTKKKSELAYFNRMTTILVFQLEHNSDYQAYISLCEEKSNMYFQLSSDTGQSLYQSEYFIALLSKILIGKAIKPTEKAMQSQKDFIAAVSHECKAPLAAILSSAEMIESVTVLPDTVKIHVQMIDSEVSRMSRLIGDLLLLSSLDAGNWSFHMEGINIDTLMINLYTKFEPICRKKDITLQLNIPDECFPPLYSDADRLSQIISIFLDNAVSYSSPESEISLNASMDKNELVIAVIDHGIGISDKDKAFIFNRFFQCDKSRTRREHFGLGLSIANELVHKLNGKIQLSDTTGGGCTFQIFLPFA